MGSIHHVIAILQNSRADACFSRGPQVALDVAMVMGVHLVLDIKNTNPGKIG